MLSLAPLALFFVSVASSSPNGLDSQPRSLGESSPFTLAIRDDSHHHHQGAPLLEFDESKVESTPPSYYTVDWEDQGDQSRHGGFMIMHGIFMGLAFFVSLPLGAFNIPPLLFS